MLVTFFIGVFFFILFGCHFFRLDCECCCRCCWWWWWCCWWCCREHSGCLYRLVGVVFTAIKSESRNECIQNIHITRVPTNIIAWATYIWNEIIYRWYSQNIWLNIIWWTYIYIYIDDRQHQNHYRSSFIFNFDGCYRAKTVALINWMHQLNAINFLIKPCASLWMCV